MNCWWGGSSHLVKNASVLSISSCLFSPPHAPIALPSLPPPPTRHILDIFTPFYLHNCLHYPVRKGMSECRGGWPIASILFPSPPYYANKKWFVTPLDGHQNRRQSSPHKRTELAPSVSFRCNSAHCFGLTRKKFTRIVIIAMVHIGIFGFKMCIFFSSAVIASANLSDLFSDLTWY